MKSGRSSIVEALLATDLDLATLRGIIIGAFPQYHDSQFTLLAAGWDSVAVDVDDRIIFKFPREEDAEAALRREAALLEVIRPAVTMPVPALVLFENPRLFSRHTKIAGEHLVTAQYQTLPESARQALAEKMGQFYAELHAIDAGAMRAAGALPLEPWLAPEEIIRRVWPLLRTDRRALAERTVADWAALPPDPYGTTYGFFDGHGWNMAFDHAAGRLNGIYDFADSGFGPLQEEFIFSTFIAADLTARIIASYEALTGKAIDRDRVNIITGAHRLWELAVQAGDPDTVGDTLASFEIWAAQR